MKALVVLSGGQDSTTCLALAIAEHGVENVHAVTFDYGQRHDLEIQSADRIAEIAGISSRHEVIVLSMGAQPILASTSPLVNSANKVEQYAGADVLPGGLEKTFIPMRNMLFLTLAANRAVCIAQEAGDDKIVVITGVSQEDYGGYPDCRMKFITDMEMAINAALDADGLPKVALQTPLMFRTKKQTVELSEAIPGCRNLLAYSHTCYNGVAPPCGKCHACLLRAKGYTEAEYVDPLLERLAIEHPPQDP